MDLVQRAREGDRRALARLITVVENQEPEAVDFLQEMYPHTGKAQVIGITGPPGSGKSTLTDKLVKELSKRGQKIGIIAVDPTSPFTGGAILGDRVRMSDLNLDENVYIRSMGARGSLGGLAETTNDVIKILDACDFDYIFIETVGVGQSEVEIINIADTVLVVMVPGLGDDIQAIKAGILEIGDIFVVNKADREGANRVVLELQMMLSLKGEKSGWETPIFMSDATENKGIKEILAGILEHFTYLKQSGELWATRKEKLERELLTIVSKKIYTQMLQRVKEDDKLNEYLDCIMRKETNPYAVVKLLIKDLISG